MQIKLRFSLLANGSPGSKLPYTTQNAEPYRLTVWFSINEKETQKTKETVIITLEKLARSAGGDRYQGLLMDKPWQIYLPQAITRPNGKPLRHFTITIQTEET